MTVVVGIRHRKGVVLAADSLITLSDGGAIRHMRGGKTSSLSETVAIASCGSPRMSQIIEYGVKLDEETEPHLGADEQRWAVRTFVPLIVDALDEAGYLHRREEDEIEHLGDSAFLLAVRNRLFTVCDAFEVNEDLVPWSAEGSGWEAAAGYLAGVGWMDDIELTAGIAEKHAIKACEKACQLNAYVDGKITTESTVRITDDEREVVRDLYGS